MIFQQTLSPRTSCPQGRRLVRTRSCGRSTGQPGRCATGEISRPILFRRGQPNTGQSARRQRIRTAAERTARCPGSSARKTMMYFSRMKAALILGVCLLGMLLAVPNLFAAPAAWMPWRTVHLGLDLRGGSYLLLEVDMKAVLKERLESLADEVRQALRGGQIFYQTLEAQPDQTRVLLRLRDASKTDAAVAALRPLISPDASTGLPDMAIGSDPSGTITLTLSATALAARAAGAGGQSIE